MEKDELLYTVLDSDGEKTFPLAWDLTHGASIVTYTRKDHQQTHARIVQGQDLQQAYRAWRNR